MKKLLRKAHIWVGLLLLFSVLYVGTEIAHVDWRKSTFEQAASEMVSQARNVSNDALGIRGGEDSLPQQGSRYKITNYVNDPFLMVHNESICSPVQAQVLNLRFGLLLQNQLIDQQRRLYQILRI